MSIHDISRKELENAHLDCAEFFISEQVGRHALDMNADVMLFGGEEDDEEMRFESELRYREHHLTNFIPVEDLEDQNVYGEKEDSFQRVIETIYNSPKRQPRTSLVCEHRGRTQVTVLRPRKERPEYNRSQMKARVEYPNLLSEDERRRQYCPVSRKFGRRQVWTSIPPRIGRPEAKKRVKFLHRRTTKRQAA